MFKLVRKRISTIIIVISWVILLASVNIFAIVEGAINPVVNEVYIESVGDELVYGSINKLRSCEFIGMEWYIKTKDGDYKKINTTFRGDDIDYLKEGKHIIGPMNIDIEENSIKNSKIRAYHRCENNNIFTKNTITIARVNS
ncbi:MAG: hypothetical protein ACOCQD_01705 [archaeon]